MADNILQCSISCPIPCLSTCSAGTQKGGRWRSAPFHSPPAPSVPLSWAMHDKRAVERSSQGPADCTAVLGTPRAPPFVPGASNVVGWAGWRLRRQMKEQATLRQADCIGTITLYPPSQPASGVKRSVRSVCCQPSCTKIHNSTQSAMPQSSNSTVRNSSTNKHTAPLVTDPNSGHSAAGDLPCPKIQGSSLPKSRVLQGPRAASLIGGLWTGKGAHSLGRE